MKQKIKKLISFLEDNQLELESLVFNKGKLSFQVSDKLYEMVITATSGINQDDRHKWYQEEKAKLKDSPITQEQVNKVINTVVKDEWVFNPLDYGFMYDKNKNCFVKNKRAVNQSVMKKFIMKAKSRVVNESWYFEIVDNIQMTSRNYLYPNLTKEYIESEFLKYGVIEKEDNLIQTVFDREKQVNIEDEKITDYKFDPLNFYGFRYNERGYFIKERKDNDKITSTFIMYPSNRESNSKTRWTFKRYTDKGIEIAFYGDLTFKSYEQVEQFFFRNGVIKCD